MLNGGLAMPLKSLIPTLAVAVNTAFPQQSTTLPADFSFRSNPNFAKPLFSTPERSEEGFVPNATRAYVLGAACA